MKNIRWLAAVALLPVSVSAQEDPVTRLSEVLPPEVSELVVQRVEEARARELPGQALARLALEGVAKGRSGEEVLSAVEALAVDLGRARSALAAAGRAPLEGEIEAAAMAMRMGVDGAEISELASSQASGRALAVPLLVLGKLAERGLPSDQALGAVRDRLGAGADDAELVSDLPAVAQGSPQGLGLGTLGPGGPGGAAGGPNPPSGVTVPLGPPTDKARRGRGRGRGPGGV
ncbi:MAG: hypothetical protein OEN56_15920 [Gemmatimonadota bacterium]|nr:hypothetical protein [Gemmatimonadota bacterium]